MAEDPEAERRRSIFDGKIARLKKQRQKSKEQKVAERTERLKKRRSGEATDPTD